MATILQLAHLDLNGNEIQNGVFQNLSAAPNSAKTGQFWFDTSDDTLKVKTANGGIKDALAQGTTYTFSTGLTESSGTVTLNTATDSALGGVKIGSNIAISSGTISVIDASTNGKGVIEIATDSEASTGTSETLAVNPKQLAAAVSGFIKLTNLSIDAGSTNYLGYDNTNGKISAKVDTTVTASSTNMITSGAVSTALENRAKIYTTSNPALTVTSGVCTWAVTHNLNSLNVTAEVYNISTGSTVIADVTRTSVNAISVKINSSANITAGTYQVVVTGK